MKLLILILLLSSCGKLDINTKPIKGDIKTTSKVVLDDGYIRLIKFCDKRYGKDTEESKECIKDGLLYRQVQVNVTGEIDIPVLCEQSLGNQDDCIADISDLITQDDINLVGDYE